LGVVRLMHVSHAASANLRAKQAFVSFESTRANEISLPDSCKKTSSDWYGEQKQKAAKH
jgi:hypothetical protein